VVIFLFYHIEFKQLIILNFAFDYHWDSSYHKNYGIGFLGDVLIGPTLQLGEFATDVCICMQTHPDFVRNDDDGGVGLL
jgi:hypothetical protein